VKLWMTAVALTACSEATPPPKPYEGPLTIERLTAAAKAFDFPINVPAIEARVGRATKVDGDKRYWAVMEGDRCAYAYVDKDLVVPPDVFDKDGAIMNRAQCLELTGHGAAPEDPNAPGPRTDGAPYEIGELDTLAIPARSKWEGKRVRVVGDIGGFNGSQLYLRDPLADGSVECGDPKNAPERGTVLAEGTVKITKTVNGLGEPGFDADFSECKVLAPSCSDRIWLAKRYFAMRAKKPDFQLPSNADPAIDDKMNAIRFHFPAAKDIPDPLRECPAASKRAKTTKDPAAIADSFAECDCKVDIDIWLARQFEALDAKKR